MYCRSLFLPLLILLLFCQRTDAQVYNRTTGIRMDDQSFGLSVVQRIAKPVTIEGILDFRRRDISTALIPRIHSRVVGRRLNAFFGVGPHAGYVKVDETTLQPFWGFGFMVGLEYKFNLLPIHISYDFRPLVQLDGHPDLFGFQSSFAIRLVNRKERKAWKEKWRKWKENAGDWLEGED